MKIVRKINNNAAVAQDKKGREMVVLGRGVGFGTIPYELTDLSRIYRTFYEVDPGILTRWRNCPRTWCWPAPILWSRQRSPWGAN